MRVLAACLMVVLAAPAWAGLVDAHFPEKSEADIVTEFEAGMGAFLEARLKEQVKPRIRMEEGKNTVYLQISAIEEDESTWQSLVRSGWFEKEINYAWAPHGKSYTYKTAELPPEEVATWYVARYRLPEEIVALAVWLASKERLDLANRELAELSEKKTDLKPDIEAWIAEKNGWDLPEGGLTLVQGYDFVHGEEFSMFMTEAAKAVYLEELNEVAEDMFDELEDMHPGTKGKPGARKRSPTIRLDMLQKWMEHYTRAFSETEFYNEKRTQKDFNAMSEVVTEDLNYIEEEKYKAERKGIEGDHVGAAKHFDILYRVDPKRPELIEAAAAAHNGIAKIFDAGRQSEVPAEAKKAALLYEEILEIYPLSLGFRNHAGYNWQAAGDKKKAKMHFGYVLEQTEGKELSASDQKNRGFAERQLGYLK